MGLVALRFFEDAQELAGLRGKIRLAVLARLTSTEAATASDSPEVVARLEQALAKLRAEMKQEPGKEAAKIPKQVQSRQEPAKAEATLRRYQHAYLELMTQRSLFLGDVPTTVRRITECSAHTLDIARVSVWLTDDGVTRITCADLYEAGEKKHSSGIELFAKDFEPYFVALREQRTIAAHDAHTDPRTSCFSTSYLAPLGIESMLDVPIWAHERMIGVICHEHVKTKRTWTADEETFAYLMSSFVALAMEQERSRRLSIPPD
jgi:hypothetical protein